MQNMPKIRLPVFLFQGTLSEVCLGKWGLKVSLGIPVSLRRIQVLRARRVDLDHPVFLAYLAALEPQVRYQDIGKGFTNLGK